MLKNPIIQFSAQKFAAIYLFLVFNAILFSSFPAKAQATCSAAKEVFGARKGNSTFNAIFIRALATQPDVVLFGEEHDQRSRFLFKALIEKFKQVGLPFDCMLIEFYPSVFDLPDHHHQLMNKHWKEIISTLGRFRGEPETNILLDLIKNALNKNIKIFMIDDPAQENRNAYMASSIKKLHQQKACRRSFAILGNFHVIGLRQEDPSVNQRIKDYGLNTLNIGFYNERIRNGHGGASDDDHIFPYNPYLRNLEKQCSFKVDFSNDLKVIDFSGINVKATAAPKLPFEINFSQNNFR